MFCGISKKFMILEQNILESIILILKNPDLYSHSHQKLIIKLEKDGFLIDKTYDEIESLRNRRNRFVYSKEYKTTLIPTFDCNYKCWYCIQNHKSEIIDPEKIQLIIKHIKLYLLENNINSYILSWFGGEPLLQTDLISNFSIELYNFCIKNNIEFNGAITSNGSLLNKEVIKKLYESHIDYYQITLDGDKKHHDRIKYQKGELSSFETILSNIVDLLKINKRANLTLRINYTSDTLKSKDFVNDVNSIIPEDIRNRISLDFQKVWQINECEISLKDLYILLKEFHKYGYKVDSRHVFSICYVEKLHYNTIFYNGRVDKCDLRGMDKLRGYIDKSGKIIWNKKPIIQDINPLLDGSCCKKCKYYPLCYGCCPVRREENYIEEGKLTCKYKGYYEVFEHRIKDYCIRELINDNYEL